MDRITPGLARFMEAVWRVSCRFSERLRDEAEEVRRQTYEWRWEQETEIHRARQAAKHHGRHLALREWRGTEPTPARERPTALRRVRGIKRLSTDQPCRVYFLVHEGEVAYVGQTSAPWPARIENHIADPDKEFDEVWYLEVDADSLGTVEARYIAELQPKYNVQGVSASSARRRP
ncbi:MAG TPA: hypothetical protein VK966_00960 [Longimicrobiales bacterium]|nr:hypothetical protein [Longimicrobiales bacterium]